MTHDDIKRDLLDKISNLLDAAGYHPFESPEAQDSEFTLFSYRDDVDPPHIITIDLRVDPY